MSDAHASDSTGTPVYLTYSQAELDAQYNQATLVADITPYRERWAAESARVRSALTCQLDVPYGSGTDEKLDIFPAEDEPDGAPIMLFIHGGAWRSLSKDDFSFPAECFTNAGAAWVSTDFSLLPDAPLSEQVRQNRAALSWLWENARSFGGDPDRIYVAGHSSGAHVAGTLLQDNWRRSAGLPENVIKGAVLVSGMFDLEPVRLSARNEYVRLDELTAARLSPVRNIPERLPPLALFWGAGELDEFRRQSRHFAETLWSREYEAEAVEISDANHFEMSYGFADPKSPILRTSLGMMDLM